MFSIDVDRPNAMICNAGWGFWTIQTAQDFLAAERAAIYDLGLPIGKLLILFDASKFSVQDKGVIEVLRNPINPLYNARRGAFVSPPGLGMLQIKHGNPQPHIGVFQTRLEARDFLLSV